MRKSELRSIGEIALHPVVVTHILLDHEERLEALEARLGAKVTTPFWQRRLKAAKRCKESLQSLKFIADCEASSIARNIPQDGRLHIASRTAPGSLRCPTCGKVH
jgi:hypothetical protein